MIKKLREDYDPNGFAVTGYLRPNNSGAYADRYFGRDQWDRVEDYAHDLLMKGLYVNIIDFQTGKQLNIDPTEYQAYFEGDFDVNNDIVNFKRSLVRNECTHKSMKEFVNNNTEEQELAEFLDWLKDENIPVTKVAKGVKTIYLQNDKDLDEASFYLQDRDYFKKLYDFGWHVAVLNKSLGRKLAGTLKMESPIKENSGNYGVEIDDSITYNDAKNEMHLMPRYFVMLKKYPKLGNNAYMLKYVDEYSDKSDYCFCTRSGKSIDKDNRGLWVYNHSYADKILPKIFPKNFKPDVLYAVWTDGPFDVQFATVSPMWGHISNYFK